MLLLIVISYYTSLVVILIKSHIRYGGTVDIDMKTVKLANRCIPGLSREKHLLESKMELTWRAGSFRGTIQIFRELGLNPATSADTLMELAFKREILGFLIAVRSGHGHFAAYHERFGQEDETKHDCTYVWADAGTAI